MSKTVMVVLVNKRRESIPEVQKALTDNGCIIKTRLGIHDGVLDQCTNEGLILLELVGERADINALEQKLNSFPGVKTKLVDISL